MDYGCRVNELYTSACVRPVRAADIENKCAEFYQRLSGGSGMQSSWLRPQPAGEPKLALAREMNVMS
jgi:hypothetical protein